MITQCPYWVFLQHPSRQYPGLSFIPEDYSWKFFMPGIAPNQVWTRGFIRNPKWISVVAKANKSDKGSSLETRRPEDVNRRQSSWLGSTSGGPVILEVWEPVVQQTLYNYKELLAILPALQATQSQLKGVSCSSPLRQLNHSGTSQQTGRHKKQKSDRSIRRNLFSTRENISISGSSPFDWEGKCDSRHMLQ